MASQNHRQGPRQFPIDSINRQPHRFVPSQRLLMRQVARKSTSEAEKVGYMLEIFERSSDADMNNKTTGKGAFRRYDKEQMTWIVIKDMHKRDEHVAIPITLCQPLLQHIMSCAQPNLSDSFMDSTNISDSTNGVISPGNFSADPYSKVFDLKKMKLTEFKDNSLQFFLNTESELPACTAATNQAGELSNNKTRRWLTGGAVVQSPTASAGGDRAQSEQSSFSSPWNKKGSVELYESLLPDLASFLTDASVRYRAVDTPPEVKALYSVSGDRRFFFDLRNTPWGNRLHISQVTDLHRNVIGIPIESLVEFRNRLNTLVDLLHLEEGKDLRDALQRHSAPPRAWKPFPRSRGNYAGSANQRFHPVQLEQTAPERPVPEVASPARQHKFLSSKNGSPRRQHNESQSSLSKTPVSAKGAVNSRSKVYSEHSTVNAPVPAAGKVFYPQQQQRRFSPPKQNSYPQKFQQMRRERQQPQHQENNLASTTPDPETTKSEMPKLPQQPQQPKWEAKETPLAEATTVLLALAEAPHSSPPLRSSVSSSSPRKSPQSVAPSAPSQLVGVGGDGDKVATKCKKSKKKKKSGTRTLEALENTKEAQEVASIEDSKDSEV